jgi:phage-related protein
MASDMSPKDKPLAWLHGEIKTPPFSAAARLEAGYLLRLLQRGDSIGMPHSRPMPTIGPRCHELRIHDERQTWRIIYRIDPDAIVLAEVFSKKTGKTPQGTIDVCQQRLKDYDNEAKQARKTRK